MKKPIIIEMFEELTDFRVIMKNTGIGDSLEITTKCQKKFIIRQDGPNLEVIKCK